MSNTPSLLPCPFCGGEARHLPGKSGYWIERVICDVCHFHLLETGSHTAVERWNRRTPQPAPVPLSDDVVKDAALWHWLAEYLVGTRTDLDDEIVASKTVNDLRKLVEAAIKQGGKT